MQDLEIFVNNQKLELIGSEVIGLTMVANDVAKLEKVNVNLSNGFSIPRTAINELILELCSEINSTSLLPYQKIPCYVKQSGIEIDGYLSATMVINEIKEKTYEVTLYGNGFDLMTALGDLKIWELPLAEWSHIKSTANVKIGVNAGLSNGWCYPVVDWGYDETNVMRNGNKNVATQNMYPALYVKKILDRIFAHVDKAYELPTSINTSIERQIITIKSQPNDIKTIPVENIRGHRQINELNGTKTGGNGEKYFPTSYTDIDNIALYDEINKYVRVKWRIQGSVTLNEYPLNEDIAYDIAVYTGDYSFMASPDPPVRTLIHEVVQQGGWREELAPKTQTFDVEFSKVAGFFQPKGERFTQWYGYPFGVVGYNNERAFEVTELPFFIKLGSGFGTSNYSIDLHVDSFIVEYEYFGFDTYNTGINEDNTVHFSQWLPDITCKDFLKAIMQIHGLNIKYDTFNDKFIFTQMSKIYENLQNSLYYDWSDKLISQTPTKHQFDLGYAQNNYVKWKDDKLDETYNMTSFNLNLTMENENVEFEKELIKIPFAASRLVSRLDSDAIPKIRMVKTDGLEKPESRYLSSYGIISGSPAIIIDSENVNEFIGFKNPFVSYDAFSGYSFFDGEKGGGEIYGILKNNPRKILALFNLDILDIYNFDFSKAVYIKYYQAFFYVNKINNFIQGKPTEVELIKL